MAAENESLTREPATRGRGRGGRGGRAGRGRGGGRGAATLSGGITKSTYTKTGRGGTRRGRAKSFADSRVQAAYERQRDLKANYQAVAHALKPALQELADRAIEEILARSDLLRFSSEHLPVLQELHDRLEEKLKLFDRQLEANLKLAEGTYDAEQYVLTQEFINGLEDIEEQFYDGQGNRLRILAALESRDLPVDISDDQYEYKVITDHQLDNDFGIYECYKDGHLVPYPSRVEGTEMWHKVRDAEAAAAAVTTTTTSTGTRGGRGGRGRGSNKRRAQDQPDGQPTPKKTTRSNFDSQLLPAAPIAPAKGLLATEIEAHIEGAPAEEDSAPASPEPVVIPNGATSTAVVKSNGKQSAREKSPPLPKNISEPDEYGCRMYNQRPSMKEKGINSRLLAPRLFWFDDHDIGFRDSSNDSSKGHTRAKRGKYLDTPNSNGMHFDYWCNGYDYSNTRPSDFDQELVKKHGLHPKYGIFLPNSTNEPEPTMPFVMPGKPVVYIAEPSGRISHASRSFQRTINYRRVEDAPVRVKMNAAMRRFCKMGDIPLEDIAVTEYVYTDEELRARSLGTAALELESKPEVVETSPETDEQVATEEESAESSQGGLAAMSVLTYATAFVEAEENTRVVVPAPKPARYDAIRDVFTDSKPAGAPAVETNNNLNLNFLAELCNVENRLQEPEGSTIKAPTPLMPMPMPMPMPELESDMRTTREDLPPVAPLSHAPISSQHAPIEPVGGYIRNPQPQRELQPVQPVGPAHVAVSHPPHHAVPEPIAYQQPPPEQPMVHAPPPRAMEYKQHPAPPLPQAPPVQEQHQPYYSSYGYNVPEPRDMHMGSGRPIEPVYASSRMANYGPEGPGPAPAPAQAAPVPPPGPNTGYPRTYWSSQQPATQAPPPPPPQQPLQPQPQQHYSQAPPPRMPFSHNPNPETLPPQPLPPLRPPRGRAQPVQDDMMRDPMMRPAVHSMNNYYNPAPARSYHHGYPAAEPLAPMPSIGPERILPNPQQQQSYMGPSGPGYAPQILSPTFGNPQPMSGPMAQSPPGTPQGMHGSMHRHRSTPSGSSDAGSGKYRKLQPAPVPAHRAWSNKPELKTIPYDHKETGSLAALPSSGPTQIRGWNVNQPRKRSKADKQDRADSGNDRDDSR
ncbi:hypothetical protein TsFJ059_008603 [Trichoderma semiorbis]|uniref:Uncharacterized protein n=1 Tax=Trichoderma semiorbis TaxID=1491008 RepID=A0A9P8KR98_9HYPO|nr:hypothetical protein TsFJ059_008603 [Trichoderma semiorbis]